MTVLYTPWLAILHELCKQLPAMQSISSKSQASILSVIKNQCHLIPLFQKYKGLHPVHFENKAVRIKYIDVAFKVSAILIYSASINNLWSNWNKVTLGKKLGFGSSFIENDCECSKKLHKCWKLKIKFPSYVRKSY